MAMSLVSVASFFACSIMSYAADWVHPSRSFSDFSLSLKPSRANEGRVRMSGIAGTAFAPYLELLNGPVTSLPVKVTLPETFYTLTGNPVDKIRLEARVGKILLRKPPEIDSFVTP